MKSFLILSIMFSIILDLNGLSIDNSFQMHLADNVELSSDHSPHEEHNEGESHTSDDCDDHCGDGCHTNCHAGHNHNALILAPTSSLEPSISFNLKNYPSINQISVLEFHSKIIRPPIS